MQKQKINIVWLKRDLRFTDHEPLFEAHQTGLPLLLVYLFEPSVMAYDDSDVRHWRFVYESIKDLNERLKVKHAQIYVFHQEATIVFEKLIQTYSIHSLLSSEEIGNGITYDRDKTMKKLFDANHIQWHE